MTRILKRALVALAALMLLSGAAGAQAPKPAAAKANFAGSWVFDPDATKVNADAAKMNGIALFLEKFDALQDDKVFTMKVDLGPMVVTAIYKLDGSPSKNMSPPSQPNQPPIEVTSIAKWEAGALVIRSTSTSPGADGKPVEVKSTRKLWLDDKGRLLIERVGTPKNMVPSSRSVYVKK